MRQDLLLELKLNALRAEDHERLTQSSRRRCFAYGIGSSEANRLTPAEPIPEQQP
jgi:hypothetical protein